MKKYSESDKNLILDLRKKGNRPHEIAALMGASEKYIKSVIYKYARIQSEQRIAQHRYKAGHLQDWRIMMEGVRYEDYVGLEYP